jgi:hypothetical protein
MSSPRYILRVAVFLVFVAAVGAYTFLASSSTLVRIVAGAGFLYIVLLLGRIAAGAMELRKQREKD